MGDVKSPMMKLMNQARKDIVELQKKIAILEGLSGLRSRNKSTNNGARLSYEKYYGNGVSGLKETNTNDHDQQRPV